MAYHRPPVVTYRRPRVRELRADLEMLDEFDCEEDDAAQAALCQKRAPSAAVRGLERMYTQRVREMSR